MLRNWGICDMTHYRQIIINMAVEDETSEQQMEELETGLQEVVLEELKDKEYIKEVTVKLN